MRMIEQHIFTTLLIAAMLLNCTRPVNEKLIQECNPVDRQPVVDPDYTSIVLPLNIAPTNFVIKEEGSDYYVQITSTNGKTIDISSRSPLIRIPMKPWRTLLSLNRNQSLRITIFVKKDNKWNRYAPIENFIAEESIDSHLVYRIIPPIYQYYNKMSLFQRDLTNFDEQTIAYNKSLGDNCVNCHSFHQHNPERMLFHMRAGAIGTSMMMAYDDEVYKVDTKTSFNRATSYRSWHPNGELVAFAFNDVKQLFHAVGENRDVFDIVSDLCLFNIKTNTITSSPKVSSADRLETYPEWSPDGRYLYFCSAPGLEHYDKHEHPYKQMKFDLLRIPYDAEKDLWGEIEPVLLASESGLSAAHAKPSPDGKYILLCLSAYSYFPLYRPESDLYLLDLQTNHYRNAEEINSGSAESYHCWSSNGRWIVFSSKRRDGLVTDAYFSYFDQNGLFSKPFILPQRDPELEKSLFRVYNVPEFVRGAVSVRPQKLIKAAWSRKIIKAKLDPRVNGKVESEKREEPMYPSFH